ncbi:MAG: translation initiation factor 2 [Eubacteriales bacterium]
MEEKLEQLRLSRRVLMNLIEKIERERAGSLYRLEKENKKLHKDNCLYAKKLLNKNRQIVELQSKLQVLNQHDLAK